MEHELKFKESSPDSRMVIPSEVLEESGISAASAQNCITSGIVLAVLHGKLTAYELIEVILDLKQDVRVSCCSAGKSVCTCDGAATVPMKQVWHSSSPRAVR
jgi:hypothetical protein